MPCRRQSSFNHNDMSSWTAPRRNSNPGVKDSPPPPDNWSHAQAAVAQGRRKRRIADQHFMAKSAPSLTVDKKKATHSTRINSDKTSRINKMRHNSNV
ncbi:hypothetical protein RB195_015738 [Necator americanus]|uniref:Uncharacterized protein n=1 Tax=Necator americanus TaxID=51031 RepID=A0ABR1E7U7_NECAM